MPKTCMGKLLDAVENISKANMLSMPQGEGECLLRGPILMQIKCSSEAASAFFVDPLSGSIAEAFLEICGISSTTHVRQVSSAPDSPAE